MCRRRWNGWRPWADGTVAVRHSALLREWALLLLLGVGAFFAALLAAGACRLEECLPAAWPAPARQAAVAGVCLLCGIGIYLGRFLRFNSWDVLHPVQLARSVLGSASAFRPVCADGGAGHLRHVPVLPAHGPVTARRKRCAGAGGKAWPMKCKLGRMARAARPFAAPRLPAWVTAGAACAARPVRRLAAVWPFARAPSGKIAENASHGIGRGRRFFARAHCPRPFTASKTFAGLRCRPAPAWFHRR